MANEILNDRELLEMAAKAISGLVYEQGFGWIWEDASGLRGAWWDPLADDGDEARLEAALGLDVVWWARDVEIGGCLEYFDDHNGDKQAARRRAGTRAAAAIEAAHNIKAAA